MKYSKQREALLTLLRSTRSHPSADWLYENLRKEFPNISLGTVYRNLAQLAENGDILKISTSANKEHFDGFVHRHFHFVCNKCDKIYDVDLDGMDEIKNQAAEKLNADIEDYSLAKIVVVKKIINSKEEIYYEKVCMSGMRLCSRG